MTLFTVLFDAPDLPVADDWQRAVAAHGTIIKSCPQSRVARLPYSRVSWRLAAQLQAVRQTRSLGKSNTHAHLVHSHFYAASYWVRAMHDLTGIPYVVSEHSSALTGLNPEKQISDQGKRRAAWVYERAAAVLPVSKSLEEAILRLGLPARRLEVIHNPVDTELFRPGDSDRRPRVVIAARLEPVKQLDHAVIAFAAALRERPDAELHIAGDGSQRARLETQVRKLAISPSVVFHGALQRPQLADLMRTCSMFMLTSHTENMPVAAIEAAASGLPVVAPRVGGLPELLDIVQGSLFDPGDLGAATQAILSNLECSDASRRLTREAAVANFSIDAIGAKLAAIYQDALDGGTT